MLTRDEVLEIVGRYVDRENLYKHTLAVEAVMAAMAEEVGGDPGLWGLTGLLHDVDYDETIDVMSRHGLRSVEIIQEETGERVPGEMLKAIKAHNPDHTGVQPETGMEYALLAADAVSGLIVASALVMPGKRLDEVRVDNLVNRFHERGFAESCSRERMKLCEKDEIPLERFLQLSLRALQEISEDLGL